MAGIRGTVVKVPNVYLRIRETPQGNIIGEIRPGDKITYYPDDIQDSWMRIEKGDISGYVYMYKSVIIESLEQVYLEDYYKSVLLNVPYASQWSSTAKKSKGDCGIACVCMVAASRGINVTVDDLLVRAGLPVGRAAYSLWELKQAAQVIGLNLEIVVPAPWSKIKQEIKQGRPVITLHKYGELSNNQDTFVGAHFSVVVGFDEQRVIVNDPNFWGDRTAEGNGRRIPIVEWERAIGTALLPANNAYQSLFLVED